MDPLNPPQSHLLRRYDWTLGFHYLHGSKHRSDRCRVLRSLGEDGETPGSKIRSMTGEARSVEARASRGRWHPTWSPFLGGWVFPTQLEQPYRDPVVPSQKVLGPSWHPHNSLSNHLRFGTTGSLGAGQLDFRIDFRNGFRSVRSSSRLFVGRSFQSGRTVGPRPEEDKQKH